LGPAPSQNASSGAALPPALELMPAQRAVFAMVSLLLRIERESQGRVRVCRNVNDIQEAMEDGLLAPVMHIEGAEAIDPNFEVLDVLYEQRSTTGPNIIVHKAAVSELPAIKACPTVFKLPERTMKKIGNPIIHRTEIPTPIFCQPFMPLPTDYQPQQQEPIQ
jgi:Membrane dipeptidase (Peptidase family M19)